MCFCCSLYFRPLHCCCSLRSHSLHCCCSLCSHHLHCCCSLRSHPLCCCCSLCSHPSAAVVVYALTPCAAVVGYAGLNENPTYASESMAAVIMLVFQYVRAPGLCNFKANCLHHEKRYRSLTRLQTLLVENPGSNPVQPPRIMGRFVHSTLLQFTL